MEIFKIVAIGVVGTMCYLFLSSSKSELAPLVLIATGIILILQVSGYILTSVNFFKELSSRLGVNSNLLAIVLKIMSISYILEFCISLCEDLGVKSMATKISLSGKLIIFVMAIPIYKQLFDVVLTLLV